MPPLLSKVTVQSVVTMTDTELSCTAYPAMPSWVDTSVLVGISCDTPAVPMTFIWKLPTSTSGSQGSPPWKDTKFR